MSTPLFTCTPTTAVEYHALLRRHPALFRALTVPIGTMRDVDDDGARIVLEMANCSCNSTIALETREAVVVQVAA